MRNESGQTPKFEAVVTPAAAVAADVIFVPVFQDEDDLEDVAGIDRATGGWVARARASGEFTGRLYECFLSAVREDWAAGRVALIGAGRRADLTPERMRRIAAACGYTARLRSVPTVAFVVRRSWDSLAGAQAAADGLSSAEFDTAVWKHDRAAAGRFADRLTVVATGAAAAGVTAAVRRGRAIGICANEARALANAPGNLLPPREFAERVRALAEAAGLVVDVLEEPRIRELGMGLLLGVAQGSAEPPRLVVIRHDPPDAPPAPVLAFVGKGITFDTGGISIKPAANMDEMKADMSGGAAVAAALTAVARLGVRRRVIGVIPMSENMPGGRAIRPGDVLTGAGGRTVEVLNTDAEGRLVLGDALWYAQQLGATHIVDVATLTGAVMIALGHEAAGLFGRPDAWVDAVRTAGDRGGERVWRLPLFDEYGDQMKSVVADVANVGGRPGGACTAAWFLGGFVDDGRSWAHLDIAGTAWAEERKPYQAKGPTGAAVRTLVELALGDLQT